MSIKGSESPQNTEYRISVRFGDAILGAGHTSVPNLVLNYYAELGISPAEMMFIIHIWQYWWTEKQPYPSLSTIADKMRVSLRQSKRYAASLKEAGYLRVVPRYVPGIGQMTNEYDFSSLTAAVVACSQKADMIPVTKMSPEEYEMSPEEYEGEEYSIEKYKLISNDRNSNIFNSKGDYTELSTSLRAQSTVDNRRAAEVAEPDHSPLPAPERLSRGGQSFNGRLPQQPAPTGSEVTPGRGRAMKAPDQLAVAMEEVSQKLNDEQPRSSLTRAVKLWRESGLPVDKFSQRVYHAQAETRQAKVKKSSTYGDGVMNRMPLFFAELERQLGFRDAEDWSVRVVPPGL